MYSRRKTLVLLAILLGCLLFVALPYADAMVLGGGVGGLPDSSKKELGQRSDGVVPPP